jgi:hypothetical protein
MEPANLISENEMFTLTFSESVENHVGMQHIGEKLDKGFSYPELKEIRKKFEAAGCECRTVKLNKYLPEDIEAENAYVLLIKNGLSILSSKDEVKQELHGQKDIVDKKALMRGKVVNKWARWNLCYADEAQEPDYQEGKGRVIDFNSLPQINKIRKSLGTYVGHDNLFAELNYYYNINSTGIGFHGDTERKLVIGIRVGASLKLHYHWYKKHKQIGRRCKITLNDGDVYIMSDKAVGHDWKKSSTYTLRHATGSKHYTDKYTT